MKNTKQLRIIAVAGAVMLIAAATVLVAQGTGPVGHGKHGGAHGKMLHRALSQLDLTEDQKVRIHEIAMPAMDDSEIRREEMQAARQELASAMHAEVFDEGAIRTAYARVANLEADRAVERARMFQEIRTVLTAEQIEELESMRATMQQHREHRREHHDGQDS